MSALEASSHFFKENHMSEIVTYCYNCYYKISTWSFVLHTNGDDRTQTGNPDNQNFTLSAEWAEWWNMDRRPLTLVSRSVPQRDRAMSNAPWGGVCVCVCGVHVWACVCVHSAARQTGSLKPPTERKEKGERKRAKSNSGWGAETVQNRERWMILKGALSQWWSRLWGGEGEHDNRGWEKEGERWK